MDLNAEGFTSAPRPPSGAPATAPGRSGNPALYKAAALSPGLCGNHICALASAPSTSPPTSHTTAPTTVLPPFGRPVFAHFSSYARTRPCLGDSTPLGCGPTASTIRVHEESTAFGVGSESRHRIRLKVCESMRPTLHFGQRRDSSSSGSGRTISSMGTTGSVGGAFAIPAFTIASPARTRSVFTCAEAYSPKCRIFRKFFGST